MRAVRRVCPCGSCVQRVRCSRVALVLLALCVHSRAVWKPVLRQHRARASCGSHVLVKVRLNINRPL